MMVQYAYNINKSNEASGEFVNEGGMFVAQLSNNITITPTLSADVTGFYASGAHMGYFVVKSMGNLSVIAKKQNDPVANRQRHIIYKQRKGLCSIR